MNNEFIERPDSSMSSLLTDVGARSRFLTRTYLNLTGAVLLFAALETIIFAFWGDAITQILTTNVKLTGGILLALCFAGPWIGNGILAASRTRIGQYCALGFYVLMYVALFLPILTIAIRITDGGLTLVGQAAGLTAAIFVALSAAVFITRKDFSFLRTGLVFASIAAFGLIVASFLFGFELGMIFTGAMIVLACLYIVYDTSKVMQNSDESCDVVASISLFASLMLLFFYILRLLLALSSRN